MAKPDFLNSSGGESAPSDPFANRPQKQGNSADSSGSGEIDNFESIPQKQGGSSDFANPNSKTSGGPKPYSAPAAKPKLPAKFSGG